MWGHVKVVSDTLAPLGCHKEAKIPSLYLSLHLGGIQEVLGCQIQLLHGPTPLLSIEPRGGHRDAKSRGGGIQ